MQSFYMEFLEVTLHLGNIFVRRVIPFRRSSVVIDLRGRIISPATKMAAMATEVEIVLPMKQKQSARVAVILSLLLGSSVG